MSRLAAAPAGLLLAVALLGGCARMGSLVPDDQPAAIVEVMLRAAGPIDDSSYYFVAFNAVDDGGATFPVPVAAGPYWGNGWGTGAITHFLQYHMGQFNLFRTRLDTVRISATGGLVGFTGAAVGTAAGEYRLTVETVQLGAAQAQGPGSVQAVANTGSQNAGALTLTTDAAGLVTAGSVAFTPAPDGGRELTAPEQAALAALNAGGVALQADSLAALGLSLTVAAAPGAQVITVAPAVAQVRTVFRASATGQSSTYTGTVTANSSASTATPPVPGLALVTGDLSVGDSMTLSVQFSPAAELIEPRWFEYTPPAGGSTLRASFDLAALGENLTNLSCNFITTTELIFDPTVTDPAQNVYDGLGPLGNDAVRRFDPRQFPAVSNADSPPGAREGAGDVTLQGPAPEDRRRAVDLVDWSLAVRRL